MDIAIPSPEGWISGRSRPVPVRYALYCLAVAMLAIGWQGDFPIDDAYITMHNARGLLQGWDTTYGVSPLIGATSLLHLALEAGLGLVMPLPYAAMAICLTAAMAYAVGLELLVQRAGAKGWQVPVLTLAGLLTGTMPTLLANGLETSLACATVTWLLLLDRRLPLLAGIAPFVRPELAILAALSMLQRLRNASNVRRAKQILLALVAALPFLAWSYFATGQILPGTMAAKVAFFREDGWSVARRVLALSDALLGSGLIVLLPGLAGLRDWRACGFLLPVVFFLMLKLPGSLTWNEARYLGPMAPLFVLGYAQASKLRGMPFLIALLGASVVFALPRSLSDLNNKRSWNGAQVTALRASLGQLPAGSRIMIHDAGMAAWAAPQMRLIDIVGLKTPLSVAAHQATTRASCHWGTALDRIARANHARYALVLERPFWNCTRSNLAGLGWRFSPLPSHGGEYHLYALAKP